MLSFCWFEIPFLLPRPLTDGAVLEKPLRSGALLEEEGHKVWAPFLVHILLFCLDMKLSGPLHTPATTEPSVVMPSPS